MKASQAFLKLDVFSARPQAVRFLILFLGFVLVYYTLTAIPWVDRYVIFPILKSSANGAAFLLNLIGCHASVKGVTIQAPDFAIAVRRGCDPLEPTMLFCAAIVAFPGPWRPKLWGIALGVPFFYGLNLLRIVSLYLTGKTGWFDCLHQEWWPALFILSAVLLWFGWLRWSQRKYFLNHG